MAKKKNRRQKWIDTLCEYVGGREPNCPKCGGHNFKDAYIVSETNNDYGWGAFWCEDCRSAFWLSRVILTNENARKKIISALPEDLKFI